MTSVRIEKEWSAEEIERLRELKADGLEWREIAEDLGRKAQACEHKWAQFRRLDEGPQPLVRKHGGIPAKLIEDRDRRAAARARQDDLSRMAGEPPPGFSALDKKRQA